MYIKIIILASFFTGTCLGMPYWYPINYFGGEKVFKCRSEPDQQAMKIEEAISFDPDNIGFRSFLLDKKLHWPQGVVPFEIDPTFSPKQVQMIYQAMDKFSKVSCVRWVKRYNQRDYVRIVHISERGRCQSTVGHQGGLQTLVLGDDCFDVTRGYQGAIAHEMMHSLGFIHEQQRIDRDCFVKVALQAIERRPNDFGIWRGTDFHFPYDFGSLMHYGTSNFLSSKKGQRLGNYEGEFTGMDILKLNHMYCGSKTFCQMRPQDCRRFHEAQKLCRIN